MGARLCVVVLFLLGLWHQSVVVGQGQQSDGAVYRWDDRHWVQVDGSGVRLSVDSLAQRKRGRVHETRPGLRATPRAQSLERVPNAELR
jgi:hypothetical protein